MSLPRLTHLQFLTLAHLLGGVVRGRDLREALKGDGVRQSGPALYQMMSVLEENGYVSGWYEQQVTDGQIVRERNYRVLAQGQTAWRRSREFYARFSEGRRGFAHGT